VKNNLKTFQKFKDEYLEELGPDATKEYKTALSKFQVANNIKPVNYNPNKDSLCVYVEPDVQETEKQRVLYEVVSRNSKYACYWSNNWRKTHGIPLKRKAVNEKGILYVRPHLVSKKDTI
jgi:hypothetical protein